MKRVMYVILSGSHKRVFQSFKPRKDMEQVIVGPKSKVNPNRSEDYSDFHLPVIEYENQSEIAKIVKSWKPDIYVQADVAPFHKNLPLPKNCKRVCVSHGMGGNHVLDMAKNKYLDLSVWKGLDLYCGTDARFTEFIKYSAGVGEDKILLNALPQLDILYNSEYYNCNNSGFNKTILFMGFCCKDRIDFNEHNEDYFKTAIELGKIAKKNNLLVMIKPRQTHNEMMSFLRTHKWGKLYIKDYEALYKNNNIQFIGPADAHIYKYYFVDAFVLNGCSTAEIEICAIQKPLFIVRTTKSNYDPFETVTSGAATLISDTLNLEEKLLEYFNSGKNHLPENQKKLLEDMKIKFDGKHSERIQDRLLEL